MVLVALLGLSWFCSPLGALVLDFNNIKSSTDVQGAGKGSQCASDKDCSVGRFCFALHEEKSFCATCRRIRRRCQRSAMCCPGTVCVNDVCTAVGDTRPAMGRNTDGQDGASAEETAKWPAEENRPQGKPTAKKSQSNKGAMLPLEPVPNLLQDRRERAVLELPTAALGFAVLAIFGQKFASRFYKKDKSAPGEDIKTLPKPQRSSSAVTVVLD